MFNRKNTGLILVIFVFVLLAYCVTGLIKETRSRAKILENDDILMFSAEGAFELDGSLSEDDSIKCKRLAGDLMKKFDPYTKGLKNVTIHHRLDLRRGLASKDKIWIRCLKDEKEFENIFLHELGHIVAQNYISDDLEDEFYNLGGDSVSGYGSEKPEEDFAESFLMYVVYGNEFRHIMQDNKKLESKYDFIKRLIFDGHEFGVSNPLKEGIVAKYDNVDRIPYDISVLHKY